MHYISPQEETNPENQIRRNIPPPLPGSPSKLHKLLIPLTSHGASLPVKHDMRGCQILLEYLCPTGPDGEKLIDEEDGSGGDELCRDEAVADVIVYVPALEGVV